MNQNLTVRKSDLDKTAQRYRSGSRFQQQSGQWYFQTREGNRGPFDSREAAELELQRYIDTMEFVEKNKPSLPSDVDWSDLVFVDVRTPAPY